MPPIERVGRTSTAVLWVKTGTDAFGEPVTAAPREIKVRWEQERKKDYVPSGQPVTYEAELVVAEDIPEGSLLWLGTLSNWYGVGSAGDETNLMEVDKVVKIPDEKGRVYRRTICLRRFQRGP